MKKTSIWFPKHGDSMEFEVEYIEYKSLYSDSIEIESIKLHGIEMVNYMNSRSIKEFEELLLEKLK